MSRHSGEPFLTRSPFHEEVEGASVLGAKGYGQIKRLTEGSPTSTTLKSIGTSAPNVKPH